MSEPETTRQPQSAASHNQDSLEPRYLRLSVMDRVGILTAFVAVAGFVIVVPYNQIGSLRTELLAEMNLRTTKLEAKIDTQTTTLDAKIQMQGNSSAARDDNIQQSFEELSATVAGGLKDRNDAILTALMGEIGSAQFYTVKAVNVPWKLLISEEWQAVYGKLGQSRLYQIKDRGALEVDFVGFDRPKALIIQQLVALAKDPEIQFAIELKYQTPK